MKYQSSLSPSSPLNAQTLGNEICNPKKLSHRIATPTTPSRKQEIRPSPGPQSMLQLKLFHFSSVCHHVEEHWKMFHFWCDLYRKRRAVSGCIYIQVRRRTFEYQISNRETEWRKNCEKRWKPGWKIWWEKQTDRRQKRRKRTRLPSQQVGLWLCWGCWNFAIMYEICTRIWI